MDGRINHNPELKAFFQDIQKQIDELKNLRFTAPQVATDPAHPRKGDMWVNTTTHLFKIVDDAGTIRVISWT